MEELKIQLDGEDFATPANAAPDHSPPRRTTDEWIAAIGASLRERRLRIGMTQEELARRADISVGAVKGLENGKGSTLRSLIRTTRVLNSEGWIEMLVSTPSPTISPMQLLREQRPVTPIRQRAPKRNA